MNNRGQVLIVFVLLLPLLLILTAYIVDTSYIAYHVNKLNNINSLVINEAQDNDLNIFEVQDYVAKNDNSVELVTFNSTNTKIEIILKKEIKSLFGKIVGKDSYTVVSTKTIPVTDNLPVY